MANNWIPPQGGNTLEDLIQGLVGEALTVRSKVVELRNTVKGQPAPKARKTADSSELSPSLAEMRMAEDAKKAQEEVPSQMEPEKLVPEGTPEGISTEGPAPGVKGEIPLSPPEKASSVQYLLHLCQCGLPGAILSGEILGPPAARRRGWRR